ncbi:glycosyltransferase family 4 protein [Paenibacillus sp. MMS18-CY102]|uniref:glycosyltransferase family 4 protein n=1 Tax=Paenibacillus sp. MMS18-CY102 TaxID=2682849 RepID=UPI001366763B|nr:glycosyltransferase family 4 protein [Paenibacillus sp. MMS18-CY102]MWC27319.1 glycosyltransferase [Paenibacillus sp. MMS18-CY102]
MKVAVVHDWLVTYAGAEKVLEQILLLYPDADLYSLVDFLPENKRGFILNKKTNVSFIQDIPFAKRIYRKLLPLMPLAIEQFDMSKYDLIISSSYAVAKGIVTGPHQLHVSYVHSPMRYAWDLQHQYLKESRLERGLKGFMAKWMLHRIRMWDYRTSNGVDYFMANSNFIANRIWKVYRRESKVIYPPVDIEGFEYSEDKQDYYITLSRMVPYKKMDLIVEAFATMPDKKLIVVGDGPDFNKIKAKATANVELLGYQPQENVRSLLKHARAFVFAAEEDFGISVVEAQAAGTPVIAFGKGGALETVIDIAAADEDAAVQPTGVFFKEQTVASLVEGVRRFEQHASRISSQACLDNAKRFSTERFVTAFKAYTEELLQEAAGREPIPVEAKYNNRRNPDFS